MLVEVGLEVVKVVDVEDGFGFEVEVDVWADE